MTAKITPGTPGIRQDKAVQLTCKATNQCCLGHNIEIE